MHVTLLQNVKTSESSFFGPVKRESIFNWTVGLLATGRVTGNYNISPFSTESQKAKSS